MAAIKNGRHWKKAVQENVDAYQDNTNNNACVVLLRKELHLLNCCDYLLDYETQEQLIGFFFYKISPLLTII